MLHQHAECLLAYPVPITQRCECFGIAGPAWPARAFEGTLPGVFPAGAVAHAFTRSSIVHVFAVS